MVLSNNEGIWNLYITMVQNGNLFNKNHAAFSGSACLVCYCAIRFSIKRSNLYRDATGNYAMVIPYNGAAGEVFKYTQLFNTPIQSITTALFIGDGASIHNNINFTDNLLLSAGDIKLFKYHLWVGCIIKIDGDLLIKRTAASNRCCRNFWGSSYCRAFFYKLNNLVIRIQ